MKVCVIDEETLHCIGCGRTRIEIAEWTGLTKNERLAIMAECLVRLTRMTRRSLRDKGRKGT